jgi:DNA helicase II / ATP-dependent DNA helicase PcrA
MSREDSPRLSPLPVGSRIDYAAELNEQQYAVVTSPPGGALVIAGAGSGKTRTLIYRVAFLLEQGIPPECILLLTFTNKAAKEMMRRVGDLLGGELPGLWGGTFHSIGNRVLRRQAELIGYERDFTILDRDDAREMLRTCRDETKAESESELPKTDVLADIFSLAVNKDQSIDELLAEQFDYLREASAEIAELHQRYQARKLAANALDFDDLLALWVKLLADHPHVCEEYQRRFQFILVDEYQDTNKLQGRLIDLLAGRHRNVMVVGDDSQSIYSWRGAYFQNIWKFPERYPGATVYRIETNYRSTPEILDVANAAIAANTNQFAKHLTPARPSGMKPRLVPCRNAFEQADFVAQSVLQLRQQGMPLHRMAVLYRSHFHAVDVQASLRRFNVPCEVTSGIGFFEQAHIKDVTAHLRFVINPRDELAFKRMVLLQEGIGRKRADKLWNAFAGEFSSGGPQTGAPTPIAATALQKIAKLAPKNAQAAWAQLTATIAQLEDAEIRKNAARMIQLVVDSGYDEYLQQTYANYRARMEEMESLARFAEQYGAVEDFLAQATLQTNAEAAQRQEAGAHEDRIRLSTIHQAKGLEFDAVFIIMLCDGLFPSSRSIDEPASLEEERRLFYVAITRARQELYLTYPKSRGFGGREPVFQPPSRFLLEIPSDLLEKVAPPSWVGYS